MNDLIQISSPLPMNEIIAIANAFHASGLFKDSASAAAAIVKIQAGNEMGIPPFAAMSGLHIVQGKVMIGGHIIAAKIKASGKYDYKIVKSNEDTCIIKFMQGKEVLGEMEFTKEKAAKAGTQNMAKWPEAMLFNRCISAGYKKFTPDVFLIPVYVPGEIEGSVEDAEAVVTTGIPDKTNLTTTIIPPPTAKPAAQAPPPVAALAAKEELSALHPNWVKVVQFVKDGGKVSDLNVKYNVSADVAKLLESVMPAAPVQQTQQMIHDSNEGYVPPTSDDDPNRPF